MTMADSGRPTHDEAWEQIPWLVNGRIAPGERAALEEHIRECEGCRLELAAQQRLQDVMRKPHPVDYAPGPSLQKLLWRIDEIGAEKNAVARTPAAAAVPARPRRVAGRWPSWVVGLQAAVIVILAAAVLFQAVEQGTARYRTVTAPGVAGADLRIMFAPGTTDRQIRQMLGESGTVIVGGPSASGVYSLALAPGVPPSAAAGVATTLRGQPGVLFVEAQPP